MNIKYRKNGEENHCNGHHEDDEDTQPADEERAELRMSSEW